MRKSAEWIRHSHAFQDDEFECAACGAVTDAPYDNCPECEADMEGEISDPTWVEEMAFLNEIMRTEDDEL